MNLIHFVSFLLINNLFNLVLIVIKFLVEINIIMVNKKKEEKKLDKNSQFYLLILLFLETGNSALKVRLN